MQNIPSFTRAIALTLALLPAADAQLDPATGIVIGTNVSAAVGASVATLNGVTFINHGLVGVGRIPAASNDKWGETLGSVSGLHLGGWTRIGPGHYTGSFHILPDRGYNSAPNFSNYAARIQKVDFTFRPEQGGAFRGPTVAQDQFTFSYDPVGSVKFTCETADGPGLTTGLVPDASTILAGKIVPFVTNSNGTATPPPVAGSVTIDKLAIDAEALVLKPDGSGYIGDEYAANIYHFNSARKIDGVIIPPAAIQPHLPQGVLKFSSEISNVNGRRGNQGMEGVALSPDGTTLFGLMQSATIQDSGSGNQGRLNTRLLVYDVSVNVIPTTPVAEYIIRLPVFNDTGSGTPNRTAAQSEIIALDNSHLLVLSRDGNGKGTSSLLAPVFKSVLLVDLSDATNLVTLNNGAFNAEGGDVTPSGTTLAAGITPVKWVEAANLLNSVQLAKFGLNLNPGATSNLNSISEKWEGMALVPTKDPGSPNTFFLFVANDNDFISSATRMQSLDGTTITTVNALTQNGVPVPNDTMFLAFRVTITGLAGKN
jgi:hypothetical protein